MQKRSIHFVGIKGVGMTPLAIIAKEAGFEVSGCDVPDAFITDEILQKANITVLNGFDEAHVEDIDLVITTGAHGGFTNPEVQAAKKKNIRVLTQGEAVGYVMSGELFGRKDMEGISVAGCHGKTTTTAMIATVLHHAGKDPSFVIGTGYIPSLGTSGHYGKGKYIVAEADEYATEPTADKTPKFLWQHPRIGVVTNIEYDHPDLYPTFASLIEAYKTFILQVLGSGGQIIACGDDPEIQKIVKNTCLPAGRTKGNILTYGFNSNNNVVLSKGESIVGGMEYTITYEGQTIQVQIPLLGQHSCLNAAAAFLVGKMVGLSTGEIQQGLLEFKGTKRRLEYVGKTQSGAAIFDDYAHHPTEIQKTLSSLRERYKDSNIICVFQPHTFSRTKLLFDEFSSSFSSVDLVILTDIYSSKREAFDESVSSEKLANAIQSKTKALYLPTLTDVVQYLEEKQFGADTIIVTMGAGDVYQIAYKLLD